jgi:hypothetical protein
MESQMLEPNPIDTNLDISFEQLQKRWNVSLRTIYLWANEGYFGIYVECNKKRWLHQEALDRENPIFQERPYLFEAKEGCVRLASSAELNIFTETGSIERLIKKRGIDFLDFNAFGYVLENGRYVSYSYQFKEEPAWHLKEQFYKIHPDYKGCFLKTDLFVFASQIENFEKTEFFISYMARIQVATQICNDLAQAKTIPEVTSMQNYFRNAGHFFGIRFDGKEKNLKSSNGLICLQYLISRPGIDVPLMELYQHLNKSPAQLENLAALLEEFKEQDNITDELSFSQELIDASTLESCENRIGAIDVSLRKLDQSSENDVKRKNLLKEKEELLSFMASSISKSHNPRQFSNTPIEKIRKKTSKSIHDAIRAIKKVCPDLGDHLKQGISTRHFAWKYHPKMDMGWLTD